MENQTFSHILCWVDGTDAACRAAEQAARLAKGLGAHLSYLAIGKDIGQDAGFEAYAQIERVSDPIVPVLDRQVRARLDQAASIAAKVQVHNVTQLIGAGDPTVAICDAAQAQGADLIVARKHKAGFVERLLNTPVSEALVSQCSFSVLSIG